MPVAGPTYDKYETDRIQAVDLGLMSPLRYVQIQQWHEVLLAGPTRNVVGNRGNDFPGLYYYDPRQRLEWVLVFSGEIDWRTAVLDRRIVHDHLLLGLFSDAPLSQHPDLLVWKHERTEIPTQWEALSSLVDRSLELLPLPDPHGDEPDWVSIALKCAKALTSNDAQHPLSQEVRTPVFRAFWRAQSAYGKDADWVELFGNASIARAMMLAAELPTLEGFYQRGSELASTALPCFFRSELGFFENAYPLTHKEAGRPGGAGHFEAGWEQGVVDFWYALDNLRKILEIVELAGESRLREYAHTAAHTMASLAEDMNFLFPLFGEIKTGAVRGRALNVSALGIFAMVMVLAAKLYREDEQRFRQAAEHGLGTLRRFPLELCYHEPHQLSCAAHAANELATTLGDDRYMRWRDDFIRAALLAMYRDEEKAGLFQCCAGMLYSGFRENVETVEPFPDWIDTTPLPLEKILRLSFRHNARFIVQDGSREGLPTEGLATLEMPAADSIGTAIYAAGQVFDLARIQYRLNTKTGSA